MHTNIPLLPFLILFTYAIAGARAELQQEAINWFPCEQNGTIALTCGTLTVPLDYSDPASTETLELALVKVEARKETKKGSILFNPGGPGAGGRTFVARSALELLVATGGVYDLIGFDPRESLEREAALVKTPPSTNSSDTALGAIWASKTTLAQSCSRNAKDVGQLIGTAFVARDMMQIVDALDEDGLLRYWGLSYGTLLGATVAAMFPDRMDKVVLDAVVNPHEYYAGRDIEMAADADEAFAGFFEGCIASPDLCALAEDGTTAEELSQKTYNLMYTLKYYPVVGGSSIITDVIDYGVLKGAIVKCLYNTNRWPELAVALHTLLAGNYTAALESSKRLADPEPIYPEYGPESIEGIRCGDSSLRSNNLTALYPLIDELYAKSTILGDAVAVKLLTCAQWPFAAKERYAGDFEVKTKSPILFIGNTHDHVTPLVSAQNASAGFEGSVLLQHDAYGHSSFSQPSLCTAKVTRAYFVNGTLPLPGTICEPDNPSFSNRTALETWEPLYNLSKRAFDEVDDTTLLAATTRLSAKLPLRIKF